MTPSVEPAAAAFDDDLNLGGLEAAEGLGLVPDGEFRLLACLGRDEHGHEQVLVVTDQAFRLARTDGRGEVVERSRTRIRSVEAIPGEGLLIRSPGERWTHRVPDGNAVYMRETIIEHEMPLRGRTGYAIPERAWRWDQLAQLIGLIVMRAAEAEQVLSILAAYTHDPGTFNRSLLGLSGKPLLKGLRGGPQPCAPAIAALADHYEAWLPLRNQLVHSIRHEEVEGVPDRITRKLELGGKTGVLDPITEMELDLPDLVDMWCAFDDLQHGASSAFIQFATGTDLSDLPMPYLRPDPRPGAGTVDE